MSFNEAMAAVERSFIQEPEVLDSDDDEMKEASKSRTSSKVVIDVSVTMVEFKSKADTKDSLMYSIARNQLGSSSIKSQKQISDHFFKK